MKKLVLLINLLFFISNLYSGNPNKSKVTPTPTVTAGCSNAVANANLQLNNVRARIDGTGGSMWLDRAGGFSAYEVPKRNNEDDPKFTSIYSGALWMGGTDVNGQLKIAGLTFRQGNDFWPGPLNPTTAEVNSEECSIFDQYWGVSRAEVNEFVAHWECVNGINGDCDVAVEYPGYTIPDVILEWPAKGNIVQRGGSGPTYAVTGQLAPFYDRDEDGFYDPDAGDYPKYDLIGDIDCRTTRDLRLFGDTTIWFVFNDKGNVHQETGGPSIGMEIRGQAFSFATNDEVNNMTFYNYEMINRSTFTLTNTYFGQWVDSDIGDYNDDFVGCDASRGLGYCYNGRAEDQDNPGNGTIGYGSTPPAVGIDFFEGPFADNDGIDNPLTQIVQDALDSNGIPYPGLGIGYGDTIVDNERYGMRKFVYYSAGQGTFGSDPNTALEYYNYLQGIWKDGSQMVWGGNGHFSTGGTVPADIAFPGDSDTLFWSTRGVNATPTLWSEFNALPGGGANAVGDRRFLESAGPFTLEPGAVNDLTIGVVWARAVSGDNLASIEALKVADDKAQSLFDNCFKIAEGPDAPDLTFQEMDQELILYLTNRNVSNNHNETFHGKNPFIAIPDTLDGVYQGTDADKDTLKFYDFQGYQIYQVKNGVITVSELDNPNLARLVAQVDLKDGITQLVNYTFDSNLGANVPKEMVNGADLGIRHSFRMTEDAFASGDRKLVNYRTYYYMAIAYGYNEYKHYDPLDPLKLDGQTEPYIASRKMAGGRGITSFSAIPHNPSAENGGTKANSAYGDMPFVTRKEGEGNGGNDVELTASSEASIVSNYFMDFPVYKKGGGPISVKVIDPLAVRAGVYQVQFKDTITVGNLNDAYWSLLLPTPLSNGDTEIPSDQSIAIENEQIFLTEGISITIKQVSQPGVDTELGNGVIGSEIEYEDPALRWLGGFADREGQTDANWIRSGTSTYATNPGDDPYDDAFSGTSTFLDPNQNFEGLIDKTWAPYRLVSYSDGTQIQDAVGFSNNGGAAVKNAKLADVPSVDIVFTSDQSKWSRAMVFEAQPTQALSDPIGAGAKHLELRKAKSVDKNGDEEPTGTGMGWFPGYAINVETGQRLNIAFAEDSWLAGENGRDMIWNPTSNDFAGIANELVMGGKHYVYVFGPGQQGPLTFPTYDASATLYTAMSGSILNKRLAFTTCLWVGIPMLNSGHTINTSGNGDMFETTAKVKLRVEKPYKSFTTASTFNGGLPLYDFDMTGLEVELGSSLAADSALALINVVPNPYYAYSQYETGKLDRRIKITNLPQTCTISIYNVNGTLMRRFQKSDSSTSLDWDLTNHVDVPIASGVYLIHVLVPDVGERTLKWYGVMKPTDLNGF